MDPKAGARTGGVVSRDAAWFPHALLFLSMWLIAGYFVLGRAIHADAPAIGLVFWRSLAGALIIPIFFWPALHKQWRAMVSQWRLLALLGIAQGVIGHVLVLYGLQSTTAVNAGLISATQPALTAITAWLILRDTLSRVQIAGLIIAMIGVLPIISRGDIGVLLELDFRMGDVLLQVAMISFAFYNSLVKRISERLSPITTLFGILTATTLTMLPLYGWEILYAKQQMVLDWATIGTIAYFSIAATVIALLLINMGIARLGPSRAGAYFFLMPLFTSVLAVALLNEAFYTYHAVGLVVVMVGVYLVSVRKRSGRLSQGR